MPPDPPRFSFGLRAKVLLLSSALLLIPWLGYRFIADLELLLRESQERALADTARAIANVIRERPSLLRSQPAGGQEGGASAELVPVLQKPIVLDGDVGDWIGQGADVRAYGGEQLIELHGTWNATSLSFSHALGKFNGQLYAFFEVTDDHVVYCPADGLRAGACDQLRISIAGDAARYIVAAAAPGPVTALRVAPGAQGKVSPEPRIAGVWRETANGYTIEIRLPAKAVGRPGFAVVDVDDPGTRRVSAVISTPEARGEAREPAAFNAAPELQHLAESIAQPNSRIWIIDRERHVVLDAGPPVTEAAAFGPQDRGPQRNPWQVIEDALFRPLYRLIFSPSDAGSEEALIAGPLLEGQEIDDALAGKAGARPLPLHNAGSVLVSAAHPIAFDGGIIGAVVVRQTTQAIGDIRQRALERLFAVTLGAFALVALTLFLYASRIAARIRRLRDEANQAIDPAGRIRRPISGSRAGDELGDLSRSFSQVLERLAQYTDYLESMARRLGHELRTPIGIVRSSLDNLRLRTLPEEALVYLERAEAGLARLNTILTRMSEANRLEQIMKQSEREQFDLRQVVSGCVEGYRSAYPSQDLRLIAPGAPVLLTGVPDLIAQLLDKLIENAVDFSLEGTPIEIELAGEATSVTLRVRNEGPPLPTEMAGRLFESMVSVRGEKAGDAPHLGLGLYIVHLIALFHHGQVQAANRDDGKGVEITVRLPRYVSDPA
jgi:two-component system, OmpR family, sensor histidine kinase ChvG